MKLHKKIKYRRKEMGLSQYQVARRVRVSRSAYANWENGYRKPTAFNLRQVGRVLHHNFGG
jgi:transcriptional regulator with XRE-family HTH domain